MTSRSAAPLVPAAFVAATSNLYLRPLLSPGTVNEVAEVCHVENGTVVLTSTSKTRTVYPVIAAPLAMPEYVSATEAFRGVAVSPVTPGRAIGITAGVGAERSLVPTSLLERTRNV